MEGILGGKYLEGNTGRGILGGKNWVSKSVALSLRGAWGRGVGVGVGVGGNMREIGKI